MIHHLTVQGTAACCKGHTLHSIQGKRVNLLLSKQSYNLPVVHVTKEKSFLFISLHPMLYQDTFHHQRLTIEGSMDASFLIELTLQGQGLAAGTVAFLDMLSAMYGKLPADQLANTIIICENYSGTPLRAQLQIGNWLRRHKNQTGKVAIVGAQAWEARVGKAIMKIARMKTIAFFKQEAVAREWLHAAS